jgi:hypothetical protein
MCLFGGQCLLVAPLTGLWQTFVSGSMSFFQGFFILYQPRVLYLPRFLVKESIQIYDLD